MAGGAAATISGLTITHVGDMVDGPGGGIYNSGTLTVRQSTFYWNQTSSSGGGIHNDHGTLMVSSCEFDSNTAANGGGKRA